MYTIDRILRILDVIKTIALISFFVSITILAFNVNTTVTQIREDVRETKTVLLSEIVTIREQSFQNTSTLISILDKRTSSIESKLFTRLESIEGNTVELTLDALEIIKNSLDKTNNDVNKLISSYAKIPNLIESNVKPISEKMDCKDNDSCWPNLMTDVLIDTRNVTRAGTRTFLTVNQEIPKIASDINTVSSKLSEDIPIVTENTTKITENIDRLTKPRWYDRFLAIAANGSLIWFNINRSTR